MDVPRYKFDRYKQRRERGEWMEEGARNDSRWLSGGVPDPTYLLTLSLSLFLLSRPPLRWNTHAVQSITGEHLFVRRLCGVALIAFRVIFNHYELVSHVCEWNWQSYLTLVFCPIRAKRSKIIFRRSFFFLQSITIDPRNWSWRIICTKFNLCFFFFLLERE